jgi:hypothetical protein
LELPDLVPPQRWVLILALISGILYLSLVPPWQHYDEPTHFEHAWLIANRLTLPERGYDQAMRREVAASMAAHDFYRGLGGPPNLLQRDKPIWIGISELHHPPFYYLLVALPLRLLRHADVTLQLRVARAVSLALFLLSIWIAYRLVTDLTPRGHPLRWAVPGMMALLPGYVDLMTAVNNDVGATFVFSLFLWGTVRLIKYGLTPLYALWVIGTAALSVWTKNTASVAVIIAPLAFLLAGIPENWRRRTWGGLAVMGVVLVGVTFAWGDAALWYRETLQHVSTRRATDAAPLGRHTLALAITSDEPRRQVSQPLLREDVEAVQGYTVTLGAWIWATRPITVRSPMLHDGHQATWRPVAVGTAPTFHALTATIAARTGHVQVMLRPWLDQGQSVTTTVYYDGLVLAEGGYPLDHPPSFDDPVGQEGSWNGHSFVNLVRNGSFERGWPRTRPWVERNLRRYTRRSPMAFLSSVLDWRRTRWVYRSAGLSLLKSFWARFGWAHVSVAPGWYWGVGIVTALGVASAMTTLVRRWSARPLPWRRSVVCLVLAGLVVWGNALLRSHPFVSDPFIPAARYTFPAIIPTALALMGGWLAWWDRPMKEKIALGLLIGLAVLNVVSLITIWAFYQGG